ncbi:hypothetical protein M0534_05225 [Methylonatrum kenyense]|uniref:hypothetical protein n=1 Tax=Methylonatrum kenyense TaxID=455253 RepID=UPI0020C003AA|nr:hypothetical protein [Methylonatrum kenyense]MCK8515728.1 hypothetical protein [Methylonatrum kenyense]
MPRLRPAPLILFLCLLLVGTAVQAGDPSAALDRALERGEREHRLWKAGWGAFYTGALGYSLYQSSEASRSADRFDSRVGAAKSAMALAAVVGTEGPYGQARSRLAGGDEPAAVARQARAAEDHARHPMQLLPGVALNLVGGLAIALGDNRADDGAISFATGMVSTTLQWATRPRTVNRASERGELGGLSSVRVAPLPGGGMVGVERRW